MPKHTTKRLALLHQFLEAEEVAAIKCVEIVGFPANCDDTAAGEQALFTNRLQTDTG